MDDNTKKLIEKYKQELLAAAGKPPVTRETARRSTAEAPVETPAPVESSPFPDLMTDEVPSGEVPAKTPTVISWSTDQTAADKLGKYFAEMPSDVSEDTSPDDFTTLPPQFTEEAPQNDFTNENVSPENNTITDAVEPEPEPQFRREGENTASNPEQTESLGTIPESGQSPDEQLGRRSFESQAGAVNDPEDVQPLVQETNDNYPEPPMEPEYADLDEFLKVNPRTGSLRFRTYTARNALPVEGARIVVSKMIGNSRHTFYDIITDNSGQTPVLEMPAPSAELSQKPRVSVQPYSLYDAEITAKGFIPVSIRSLPVFEGILSVQRVALVPSAGTNERENITESEPDLTEVRDA